MSNDAIAAKLERLQIRRLIAASPERVFNAWTDPEEMKMWWGPTDVRCVLAEVELRVGGRYRIGNEMPDGNILWIVGEFERIEVPHLLVYTWMLDVENSTTERVSVQFERHESGTEVVLTHEQISTPNLREQHQQGWIGCLDGLSGYLTEPVA